MARRTWIVAMLLAPALLASGCERARPIAAEATDGKLAARVNGVAISLHQVAAGSAAGSTQGASPAQALEKVIDRELLVQKALAAGVTILATISAPTSLAVDLARDGGITLIAFLRESRCNIYAGQSRITSI